MKALSFALVALVLSGGAAAQKVYRCGPEGRVYQQTPCADGKLVDADDKRTAEQRQAAQGVAKSEAKAAAQFDRAALPASAAKGGKAEAGSAAKDKPASAATGSSKRASEAGKAPVYIVPAPKPAAAPSKP